MSSKAADSHDLDLASAYSVNQISMNAPWEWLAKGWADLWKKPALSLGYGLVFSAGAAALTVALTYMELTAYIFIFAGGFMLIGPMMAVGLYELSRRHAHDEPATLTDIMFVKTRAPGQLSFIALALLLAFLAWIRIASLLVALVFGITGFPPLSEFIPTLLFTWPGLALLSFGSLVGGLIAFGIFAISATSVPLLMVRKVDAMTAIILSIKAVKTNFWPMLLWAWLIALMMAFGFGTLYFGLMFVFPLIGHATWHALNDLIEEN